MPIIKKYRWFIIILTVLAGGAALVFSLTKPVQYDTSISFAINRINKQTTPEYQYDGYYAIQASDLFAQTVMSWFMTPSVLLEIYDQAKIDPQIKSVDSFTSRFKTKKFSSQNIVVRYTERDQQTAEKIAAAITAVIQDKGTAANQTSDQKALFEVVGSKPVVVAQRPIIWMQTLVGLIAGLLLSSVAAYVIEYLRLAPQKPQ